MDGRVDGWMEGWMDGWMDGRMDGWMVLSDEYINKAGIALMKIMSGLLNHANKLMCQKDANRKTRGRR